VLSWPTLGLTLQIDLPALPFNLPCIYLPQVQYGCVFTGQMHTLLILTTCVIIVAVVISSDIIVMLHDRINRCKLANFGFCNRSERPLFFRHNVMMMLLELCIMICWKSIELITSFGGMALVQSLTIFADLQGSQDFEDRECEVTLYIFRNS